MFRRVGAARLLSVAMMLLCLTFLTSINYFLYPGDKASSEVVKGAAKNNIPPSGPTEEKSPSSGISIIEEFLHDPHPVVDFSVESPLQLHGMTGACRILVYHGELLSPPPEV